MVGDIVGEVTRWVTSWLAATTIAASYRRLVAVRLLLRHRHAAVAIQRGMREYSSRTAAQRGLWQRLWQGLWQRLWQGLWQGLPMPRPLPPLPAPKYRSKINGLFEAESTQRQCQTASTSTLAQMVVEAFEAFNHDYDTLLHTEFGEEY